MRHHAFGNWTVLVGVCAVIIWIDARGLGMGWSRGETKRTILGPTLWALGVLIIPIIYVPLYAWRRRRGGPITT